jgi:hypothetical protein
LALLQTGPIFVDVLTVPTEVTRAVFTILATDGAGTRAEHLGLMTTRALRHTKKTHLTLHI